MEFVMFDKEALKEIDVDIIECDLVYGLKIEGKTVGLGFLNFRNSDNILNFYIIKEYQGNGYGKILFGKMLEILKENNYQELMMNFSKDNIKVRKIVEDFGGLNIANVDGILRYVVPIK